MKYAILSLFFFFSVITMAQEVDSAMIYIEQEFYAYDLPHADSVYLDSVYKVESTSLGFIAGLGYNDGVVIEVGYGKSFYGNTENRTSFQSFYGGVEVLPSTNNRFIVAPKASVWLEEATYLTAVGLSMVYYTDFNEATLRLRPEIGVGYKKVKLTYGYNVSLVKGNLTAINEHNIGLAYFFETKKNNTKATTYRQYLEQQKKNYANGDW